MLRHLLPFGLVALFFNLSFAQTIDTGRGGVYGSNPTHAPRAAEPVAPLTLKAALELA
ncbi:MAG: TolC family protein, partial [Gallionella sp.]